MPTIRYYASARAAAGISSETLEAPDLESLVVRISELHGPRMRDILDASSLMLDGLVTCDRSTSLQGIDEIDVLPPFAGG